MEMVEINVGLLYKRRIVEIRFGVRKVSHQDGMVATN